jgi:hypothetical protein
MMAVKPMSFVAPVVGTLGLAPCVQGAPVDFFIQRLFLTTIGLL